MVQEFLRLDDAVLRDLKSNPFPQETVETLVEGRKLALDENGNSGMLEQTSGKRQLNLVVSLQHDHQAICRAGLLLILRHTFPTANEYPLPQSGIGETCWLAVTVGCCVAYRR